MKIDSTRTPLVVATVLLFSLLTTSVLTAQQGTTTSKGPPKTAGTKKVVPVPVKPGAQKGSVSRATARPIKRPGAKSTGRYGLKAPPLKFSPPVLNISESVFDWGSVLQGEVVVHPFQIENTGNSPLRIESVKPSCGCTTVDFDDTIAPGKTGTVTLKVETKKFSGSVKKTAELRTNAGRSSSRLVMQGKIDPAVTVEPKLPRKEIVLGVPVEPLTVKLTRASQHKINIKSVSTKSDVIDVELKEVEPGEQYNLVVTPKISDVSKKYHYAQVDVMVNVNDKSFELPVRVSMTVKDPIAATPASVYFSRRDTDKLKTAGAPPASKTVKIECLDPKRSFRITDVEIKGSYYSHRLETVEEGKKYNLVVLLSQLPTDGKRRIVEKILVKTDDPKYSTISLTATASIGRATPARATKASASSLRNSSAKKVGTSPNRSLQNGSGRAKPPIKVTPTPTPAPKKGGN